MITHVELVGVSDEIAEAYRDFEREHVMAVMEEGGDAVILAQSAAALMNKLGQFANGAVYDSEGGVHEVHDEKLARLSELISGVTEGGVLVFYQYKHDADRIARHLKGLRVARYKDERDLKAWNDGNIDVLLAHPASTAFGLNMQKGGNYIVWFGTGWNLELYQQANARLHRQGQTKPVHVYQLLTAGTVDLMASKALMEKIGVQQALLDGLGCLVKEYAEKG